MKVGDVVKLRANYRMKDCDFGIIVRIDSGHDARDNWIAYEVRWSYDSMWHGDHELELISESR